MQEFKPGALEHTPSSLVGFPLWPPPTSVDGGDSTYQYMYTSLLYQYNTELPFLRHQVVELTHKLAELDRWKMQNMCLVRDLRDQNRALQRKIGDDSPVPFEHRVDDEAEAFLSKARTAPPSASPPPPPGTPGPMPGPTPGRMLGPFNSTIQDFDADIGLKVYKTKIDGADALRADWKVKSFSTKLHGAMGRPVVSAPFDMFRMEDLRLMITPEVQESSIGSRSRKEKEQFSKMVSDEAEALISKERKAPPPALPRPPPPPGTPGLTQSPTAGSTWAIQDFDADTGLKVHETKMDGVDAFRADWKVNHFSTKLRGAMGRPVPPPASPPLPSGTPDPGSTPELSSWKATRVLPVEELDGTRLVGEFLPKNEVLWGKLFVDDSGEEYIQLADDAGELTDKWVTTRKMFGNETKLKWLATELIKFILTVHVDLTTVTATSMGGNELVAFPVSPDMAVRALHKELSDAMECNPKALATVLADGRELRNLSPDMTVRALHKEMSDAKKCNQ